MAKTIIPKLNRADFFRFQGDEVIHALTSAIAIDVHQRPSQTLTGNQQAIVAWGRLLIDVPNGGFTQFFYNHRGDSGIESLGKLLRTLDVPKVGPLLYEAVAIYREHQSEFMVDNPITATSGDAFSYLDNALPANAIDTNGTAFPALEETNAGVFQVGETSMVDSLVVVFNEPVTIASPATAFSLSLKMFDNNVNSCVFEGDATTTVTASNPSGDGITWVLQFSGGTTNPVTGGSIADGDYYLNLTAGSVASVASPTTTNASYQTSFYRLFGDIGGSGSVANSSLTSLKRALGATSISQSNYNAAWDYEGAGAIANIDLTKLKQQLGTVWTGL